MQHDFASSEMRTDVTAHPEVPRFISDFHGREVVIVGDPEGYADFNHQQGDNSYGFQGDCGLVSCQDVLLQYGVDVQEEDVVDFAAKHGLCEAGGSADMNGGTSAEQRAEILKDYGVPSHVEGNGTLETLASHIEQGKGAIIAVNAGVLWNDSTYYEQGQSNHAITVTGVVHDAGTGQVLGFYVNDSGDGKSAKFVDANTLQHAWVETGGISVVTDVSHPGYPSQR